MNWTEDIELLLKYIFENAVIMNELHKKRFLFYKGQLKFYRIPIIILSGFNSVLSVGLSKFVNQDLVSVITCLVSLFFLGIHNRNQMPTRPVFLFRLLL